MKQFIDETGGEIRVYGTPGEEGGENGSAKGSFVREGFEDVDVALCVHPAFRYGKTTESLANDPVDIKFTVSLPMQQQHLKRSKCFGSIDPSV